MTNYTNTEYLARAEAHRRQALGLDKQQTVWQYLKTLEQTVKDQGAQIQELKTQLDTISSKNDNNSSP